MKTVTIEKRNFKIDWFKAFLKTEDPDSVHIVSQILQVTPSLEKSNEIVAQKFWHEIWSGENYRIYVKRPPSEADRQIHEYCVELTGKFISFNDINQIRDLCEYLCEEHHEKFWMSRIDLAADFYPYQGLNIQPWEQFKEEGKLKGYRGVSRIVNSGQNDEYSSTVYLGSRRSEQMVRLYCKKFDEDEQPWDRWEVELKGWKADQCVEKFLESGPKALLDILFGSIELYDEEWFNNYKITEGVSLTPKKTETSIEKSIKFLWSINASMAMVQEFLGPQQFTQMINEICMSGRHKLKNRHLKSIQTGHEQGLNYETISNYLSDKFIGSKPSQGKQFDLPS